VSNNTQAGNTYAAQGLELSTLFDIPATVDTVGDTFGALLNSSTFWLLSNANSVSPPNFAVATDGGFGDVFMSFASPITSLSLLTDDTGGEAADVVRLLALKSLGGGNYEVIAVAVGSDDATTSPANLLEVNVPAGFSFAVFQTTTEQEGFDDLTFTALPEPGIMALVSVGLATFLARRARRR
jgi:hypothetical protein